MVCLLKRGNIFPLGGIELKQVYIYMAIFLVIVHCSLMQHNLFTHKIKPNS
jgi:hypothetical protein